MQDNWIFKKKYITMCEHYFNEYGNKTMLISKFLPIRSMIPLVAGVIMKPFVPFVMQSILSAILWVGSLLGISYFIIWLIPEAANHIGLLTFLFVVLPQVVSIWYMILPAMKKYEAKLLQAKDNFQHIADEVSVIGAQFAAI
jgi:membrane-associated protein